MVKSHWERDQRSEPHTSNPVGLGHSQPPVAKNFPPKKALPSPVLVTLMTLCSRMGWTGTNILSDFNHVQPSNFGGLSFWDTAIPKEMIPNPYFFLEIQKLSKNNPEWSVQKTSKNHPGKHQSKKDPALAGGSSSNSNRGTWSTWLSTIFGLVGGKIHRKPWFFLWIMGGVLYVFP